MKLVLFRSIDEATVAQRKYDEAAGLPRLHTEGQGPDDYRILHPDAAADAIRAAGVRTEHRYAVVVSPDGVTIGLANADDPAAVEVDTSKWSQVGGPKRA